AAANGVYLDELYTNNALNELKSASQGELNGGHTAITAHAGLDETFTLDGMGNWFNYTNSSSGADQERDANSLNQITSYDGTSSWALPVYNDGGVGPGNMTTVPQPGNETTGLGCVYDAWNRLVAVYTDSTDTTLIASYSYDGLNRRMTETAGGET